jgi:hypothetical protein
VVSGTEAVEVEPLDEPKSEPEAERKGPLVEKGLRVLAESKEKDDVVGPRRGDGPSSCESWSESTSIAPAEN